MSTHNIGFYKEISKIIMNIIKYAPYFFCWIEPFQGVQCRGISLVNFSKFLKLFFSLLLLYEPRREKTSLRDFRPGPTQTGLYSYRRWLEA